MMSAENAMGVIICQSVDSTLDMVCCSVVEVRRLSDSDGLE